MREVRMRRPGALGALVDELERAMGDFDALLARVDGEALAKPRTSPGTGEITSVGEVAEHVLYAAHLYAALLRTAFRLPAQGWVQVPREPLDLRQRLQASLDDTWELLQDKTDWSDEQVEGTRMTASWGSVYDLEQLLEHAICHVLRHRRQVEGLLGDPATEGGV